jgi:hypothetical protein
LFLDSSKITRQHALRVVQARPRLWMMLNGKQVASV